MVIRKFFPRRPQHLWKFKETLDFFLFRYVLETFCVVCEMSNWGARASWVRLPGDVVHEFSGGVTARCETVKWLNHWFWCKSSFLRIFSKILLFLKFILCIFLVELWLWKLRVDRSCYLDIFICCDGMLAAHQGRFIEFCKQTVDEWSEKLQTVDSVLQVRCVHVCQGL